MQRKYSEVVKFTPNFQELESRRNNKNDGSNQKHSPV